MAGSVLCHHIPAPQMLLSPFVDAHTVEVTLGSCMAPGSCWQRVLSLMEGWCCDEGIIISQH